MTAVEKRAVLLINGERRRKGLTTLLPNDDLHGAARIQSRLMRDGGFFDHRSFAERIGAGWAAAAENIAWRDIDRDADEAQKVVAGWMESSRHRRNILSPDYKFIGIGRVDNGTRAWWTADFGG